MALDQVPDYRQTKSKTAMRAGRRDVGLPEPLEYIRQEVLTNALSGIGHNNLNARINRSRPDLYAAALGSKLGRVGKQVPNYLLQSFRISGHCACQGVHVSHKLDVFSLCRRAHDIQGALDDLGRLDRLQFQPQFAGDDAGYIEEI